MKMESFSILDSEESKQQREDIEKLADELHSTLVENYEPREIPESIFAGYFLPRILGEVKDPSNIWISEWTGVAGSVAAPVNVISDVTGDVLFKVPPLLQTSKLGTRGEDRTLNDVVKEYNMMKDNPVQNSKGFINKKLSETLYEVAGDVDLSEEISQWENILKLYGRLESKEGEEFINDSNEEDISDLLIFD